MVRVKEYKLEPTEKERGLINYFWDQVELVSISIDTSLSDSNLS
jgi:hypothetical protein